MLLACLVLSACGGGDEAAQPALTIITPQATDASTTRGSIDITGEVRDAPPGTIVTVDGDEVDVDSTGGFSDRVGVDEGTTTILVEAVLPDGGVLSEEVAVTRTLTPEQQAARAERERQAQAAEEAEQAPPPEPDDAPSPEPAPADDCDPGYSGCVPVFPPDVNCPDVDGPVTVTGSDPHGLDRDGDGVACE
jgi:hypothetical protein